MSNRSRIIVTSSMASALISAYRAGLLAVSLQSHREVV
jgi:hypothetical protein